MIKCQYLWDISHKYKNTRKFFSKLYFVLGYSRLITMWYFR